MKVIKIKDRFFIKANKEEKQVINNLDIAIQNFCLAIEGNCGKCPFHSFNDCNYPSFALSLNNASNIFK